MIDNHNFFRDYTVRENDLEEKPRNHEAEDWLEQREQQRKIAPPATNTDASMPTSENQETRRCGGNSTITESISSLQKMNTEGKPPPRCANCHETIPWTHRASYPRINKTPINKANAALIKLHKVRTLCETCMAQSVRDAVWLVRNMEGIWKYEELILDNTKSCEKIMQDIIRQDKEVIHVESILSSGMTIPELTVKIARTADETRPILEENNECFKLKMNYTQENLTATVTKPDKRCLLTKEIMEMKMERYKTGRVEWKESNGIAAARIIWQNEEHKDIAIWTQTWKAPTRTPSINEENMRFMETIRTIVRNPHSGELPINDEEKNTTEESRKRKGTMIRVLKLNMKAKHETQMEIASETVPNFVAITNIFEPEAELWERQVSVRVMKRKDSKEQIGCGIFPKDSRERRCGGSPTIIDPDQNLEEVLRIWAKITDSVEDTAQRIERRLLNEAKKKRIYKLIVPGDKERSLDKVIIGETTLEWYDWSKQQPHKNLILTIELLWLDDKANSWIQEEEQFNDIHVPSRDLHLINKEWDERLMPQVGDWFKSIKSNLTFTTSLSSNPRKQRLTSKVEQGDHILCKINHETSRQIRKIIPERYNNETHYKVETRIPEWKGPVFTTIAIKKRNGNFENRTELYMRPGNTRDEAKRRNVIFDYPFDELQELGFQK